MARRLSIYDADDFRASVVRVSETKATVDIKTPRKWEEKNHRYCAVLSQDNPPRSLCESRKKRNAVKMKCRRTPGDITFGRLEKDTKYHVTAFTIDRLTGLSRSYHAIPFVTLVSRETMRLPQNKILAGSLNPIPGTRKDYMVEANQGSKLFVSVQPCQGTVEINITMRGIHVISKRIIDAQKIVVDRVDGDVVITVANPSHDYKIFRVWASTDELADPFPVLPLDTDLRSTKHTCTDVVLEWSGGFLGFFH